MAHRPGSRLDGVAPPETPVLLKCWSHLQRGRARLRKADAALSKARFRYEQERGKAKAQLLKALRRAWALGPAEHAERERALSVIEALLSEIGEGRA